MENNIYKVFDETVAINREIGYQMAVIDLQGILSNIIKTDERFRHIAVQIDKDLQEACSIKTLNNFIPNLKGA